jgi:hypothetical protein
MTRPHPPALLPPLLKVSFYAQNRIESTFNRIETSCQLILVFLIEFFLKKFFFIVFESTSIRLKKIANRSPLLSSTQFVTSNEFVG